MLAKNSLKYGIQRRLVYGMFVRNSGTASARASAQEIKPFEEIPGPRVLPILGTLWKYFTGDQPFEIQRKCFEEYGPIYRDVIGDRVLIQLSDANIFRSIFQAEGKIPMRPWVDCWKRYRERRKYCIGITNQNGDEWYKTRRALAPKMLRPKEVKDNTDNFNAVNLDMVRALRKDRNENNEILDFGPQINRWSTESIGTYVFDTRIGLYDDPPNEDALTLIENVRAFITETGKLESVVPLYKYVDTPSWKRFCDAQDKTIAIGEKYVNRKIKQINEEMIEDGELNIEGPVPVLTHLLSRKELTPHEVTINACEVLFGGVDTTATMVTWILFNVTNHPDVQERLHQEIVSVLEPGQLPTFALLQKMPFLKACVKESLRLFPPVHYLGRIVMEDTVLCGYEIPTGTTVMMNFYATSRSEEYFDDPLEYKPERWLRSESDKFNPFLSLPFGHGARMCIGRRVAEGEVYLLMALLFREFKVEYIGEPIKATFRFFLTPDKPLKVRFIDRV